MDSGRSILLPQERVAHQYPGVKIRANWEEWRHNWYFVLADNPSIHLLVTTAPAENLANSKDMSSQDESLLPAIERLIELRDSKVTCAMITGDFIRRGIAPLQRRPSRCGRSARRWGPWYHRSRWGGRWPS